MEDSRNSAFDSAMREIYLRTLRETGYRATYFLQMIDDLGGVETAKKLIHSPRTSDGYTELWKLGRLDLTAEALVLRKEWSHIFDDNDKRAAYDRLFESEYKFPSDLWKL